ncbi:MAG: site-specific integrase [Methanobacterium sp.]|jgi:integrase|nr:site-specific integrase [Methanobacterium sp.]
MSLTISQIELMDRKVTLNLLRYKKFLIDDGKAPSTINLNFAAIKSFYKAFQIILPEIVMDKGDLGLEKNQGKRLKKKDILKMIGVASPRERALIYLMALSGMGQQEARNLTIKVLLDSASEAIDVDMKSLDDLYSHEELVLKEVLILTIRRKKVKYRHQTFSPPEVTRELINYLKERCYGRNENIRVHSIYDKIFVNKHGGELSCDSIVTNFRRTGQEAGFTKENGSYSFWRSHAMRKYFISKIINKTGEKIIADYMAGHKISEQDRTYWMANPDDLKKLYLRTLPLLSIDNAKVRDVDSDELKIVEADSKRKDERIEALEKRQEDYDKQQDFVDQLLHNEEFRERFFGHSSSNGNLK